MDQLEAMGFDPVRIEEARKACKPEAQVEDILEVLLSPTVFHSVVPLHLRNLFEILQELHRQALQKIGVSLQLLFSEGT